jgi:nitronate monooxygenase
MTQPNAELTAMLNTLLEAERAGARVGAALVAEAADPQSQALARAIHDDEVKWAKVLFEAVRDLGAEPSEQVGDFYEKAMAIEGFEARVAFVNRGQGWVVRKLRELIPQIEDTPLAGVLEAMLDAHVVNIETANRVLASRGAH